VLGEVGIAIGLSSTLTTAAPASPGTRESVLSDVAVNERYFSHLIAGIEVLLVIITTID
jgi:hypothetical protein